MSSSLSSCSSSLSPPSPPGILDSASQSGQFCAHTHLKGHLPMSGDMFGCHSGWWGRATGTWEVETQDTCIGPSPPHPTSQQGIIQPQKLMVLMLPYSTLHPASAQPSAKGPLVSSPIFSIREGPPLLCVPFRILCKL